MGQRPLRLLRQTDHRRQGSVRAQFDQPAQRHLGESRLETAAGRLAQVAEQLRGVAHAGLAAVDPHQTPASIKGTGVFGQRGQRAQGRPHDGLEYAHPGGGAPLAQVAVGNLHAGQLLHVGRQRADAAQDDERPDFAPTADRSTWGSGREVWDRAGARVSPAVASPTDIGNTGQRCRPIQSKYLRKVASPA